MNYYDKEENIKEYVEMAKGYDGKELIEILKTHLKKHSTVLELGMGPGKDLDLLKKDFVATGSDSSQLFLDLYKKKNINPDLILLDAVEMTTSRKFDCIYSNKVLQHITRNELKNSFEKQKDSLNDNGILFHSFWYGDTEDIFNGLRFTYYTKALLKDVINDDFEIIELNLYTEMETNDSLYVILRKTN